MHAFDVLGDPVRRRILELLADGEVTSGAVCQVIQAEFGISQPAVSQHLAALRLAGLVRERREGRRTYYRIEPAGLHPLIDWMARTGAFWPGRIERLKDLLKRMDQ